MFAPDLVEAEQLLHFLKHQFHLPPGTIYIQHVGRRPGASVQRGDEQQPARHDKGGRRDGPPRLLGFASLPLAGALSRRGIELRGHQSYRIAPPFPAAPAVPLPLRTTSLPEPAQHIEGLSRLSFHGEGGWMYTENDRCLLTDRQRYTPAIAIAVVRHNDLPG